MTRQIGFREMPSALFLASLISLTAIPMFSPGSAADEPCAVRVSNDRVTLESPHFRFVLDGKDGLRAIAWENRLTGRTLQLGGGPEVELEIGLPNQPLQKPVLTVETLPDASQGSEGQASFTLRSEDPHMTIAVTYRWNAQTPVLTKSVTVVNNGEQAWNRLLHVELGRYTTDAQPSEPDPDYPAQLESPIEELAGRTRGFPAYVENQFFVGLAHPAGFALFHDQEVLLRQMPGRILEPRSLFFCQEAVYGVSTSGNARQAFRDYLQTRMRRVVRGHDKPLAIFEPFGGKPDGSFWETEEFVLDNLTKVINGQQQSGLHWDYYSIDFWHDPSGDLITPDRNRFPHGFSWILPELKQLGTRPGLWLDSGNLGEWTIARNPAVAPALAQVGGGANLGVCRATEPIEQFYREGYRHQLRENGVRLVKFDNALLTCDRTDHEHLPGEYSTEPIENAIIGFLHSLDEESPDVFIMLYWNYRSPWWLLHADTVFDVGMHMEGASFFTLPTLRARDGVTRRLDAGRWMLKDWPALGWDTLGIWLSDWPWNSRIGKVGWQSGVVMDISRGHLLAQLWSDTSYLSPDERREMAELIAVLKARPDCFRNTKFVLGNPWRDEPYGYCGTDGRHAMLAIHNGTWSDNNVTLQLNSQWGLPDNQRWNLYRHWPNPAQLGEVHEAQANLCLRPFETVLLEAVPVGESNASGRSLPQQPLPGAFRERTQPLGVTVTDPQDASSTSTVVWTTLKPIAFESTGGATFARQADESLLVSGVNSHQDQYCVRSSVGPATITAVRIEALPDPSLPGTGPGRAVNGNFTLAELQLFAAGQPIQLVNARADYAQTSFGGWPVEAALDGNLQTGWGIDPAEGVRHIAAFEFQSPLVVTTDTELEFRLTFTDRQHSLGRFRLSVTAAPPPIDVPTSAIRFTVRGTLPATQSGGVLAISDCFFAESKPYWSLNCKTGFSLVASLDGQPVEMVATIDNGMYAAPWQTWSVEVPPADVARSFEVTVDNTLPANIEHRITTHFLPSD
jgi:hypothetical protein